MRRTSFALGLLLAGVCRAADLLSTEQVAIVDRDMGKEMASVEKKYGNRKPNELSLDERKTYTRDRAAAEQKVLDKHGVDAKAYANRTAKLSRSEREEVKALGKALEDKEKAEGEKQAQAAKEPKADVQVQRGFNENAPVTLEEKSSASGEVVVEKGLPTEAQADQDEAESASAAGGDGSAQATGTGAAGVGLKKR